MKKITPTIYILVLLGINLISHWYVFFDKKILLTGDWTYFFPQQLVEFSNFYLYFAFLNLGQVWAFPGNSVFYHLYYFLSLGNIGYDLATRIIFILPILILTPLFSFKCFLKILKNQNVAFFAASIYCYNTFFLRIQTDFLTWAITWWILPALILSIILWLESGKSKYLFANSILVFLAIAFEIRLAILILIFSGTCILFEIFVSKYKPKRKIKIAAILIASLMMGISGHLYWIFPILLTNISSSILSYVSPNPFVSFYTLKDVLSLHLYYWSKNLILEPFIRQPFEFQNYLIIFLVFLGILSKNINNILEKRRFIFFTIWFVILVFIGKQELLPFSEVYGWLFNHVPIFNLYRESSKFFILISFCLSIYFGLGLAAIYNFLKIKFRILSGPVIFLLLFFTTFYNLQHFLDQKVGGLTKGVDKPLEYTQLEKMLADDKEFYRILWLPTRPDFGFNSNVHPAVNGVDLTKIYKNKTNFVLFDGSDVIQNQITFLLNQQYSHYLLNSTSVRYVIVPSIESREVRLSANKTDLVNKYFEFYGPRESYVTFLDNLKYLKKVNFLNSNIDIYENLNYFPHLYSDNHKPVTFKAVSPTEYEFMLTSRTKKLYFAESFDANWQLVKNNCDWLKMVFNKKECVISNRHDSGQYGLNEFDAENLLPGRIIKLYFYPQVFVNLGITLSVFLLMSYIVFLTLINRNEKSNF